MSEATAEAKAKADNAFDAQAIRRRRRIEKDINEAADKLEAARAQLSRVRIATRRNARGALQARESEARLRVAGRRVPPASRPVRMASRSRS